MTLDKMEWRKRIYVAILADPKKFETNALFLLSRVQLKLEADGFMAVVATLD